MLEKKRSEVLAEVIAAADVLIVDDDPDGRGVDLLLQLGVDVKSDGAWASAVSNSRDLSVWRGLRSSKYVVGVDGDGPEGERPVEEALRVRMDDAAEARGADASPEGDDRDALVEMIKYLYDYLLEN